MKLQKLLRKIHSKCHPILNRKKLKHFDYKCLFTKSIFFIFVFVPFCENVTRGILKIMIHFKTFFGILKRSKQFFYFENVFLSFEKFQNNFWI